MPNFREEIYQSTGDLSVNDHFTPTLYISQTKILEVSNILERLNDTNVPAVLKLQASGVCVCDLPLILGVCLNYEVVEFQPRTVTPLKPRLRCLLLHSYY